MGLLRRRFRRLVVHALGNLFWVDIGVGVCGPGEAQRNASKAISYSKFLSIKIRSGPCFRSPVSGSDGASERLADMKQGQFHLSVGVSDGHPIHPSTRFLRNLSKVKLLMHLYRFWLEGQGLGERQRLGKQLNTTRMGRTLEPQSPRAQVEAAAHRGPFRAHGVRRVSREKRRPKAGATSGSQHHGRSEPPTTNRALYSQSSSRC